MRFEPQDFVVEEITPEGEVLEAGRRVEKADAELGKPNSFFAHFVLQKRLWTTSGAVRELARRLHVSQKRLNYAGNKDRNAVTVQRVSAFAVPPENVLALKIRDLEILGAWKENEKVGLGQLAGNRFTIRVPASEFPAAALQKKAEEAGYAVPNFFGEQRFGSVRRNTHEVGRLLLQGKHEEAILNYLTFDDGRETDAQARQARKNLAQTRDFGRALKEFPAHLRLERTLAGHLAGHPNDYLGAFRKLHRGMQLLFIHAFQSHLFNQMVQRRLEEHALLEARIGDGVAPLDAAGFPQVKQARTVSDEDGRMRAQQAVGEKNAVLLGQLIGYESVLSPQEERMLEREGVERESFRLKSLPELGVKGGPRPLFAWLKDLQIREQESRSVLRFSLPSGSYATVALATLGVA